MGSQSDLINNMIRQGAGTIMSDKKILEREITSFKASVKRSLMIQGEKYYSGDHDILNRKRTVIGEAGQLVEVENLPNNKIVDNQYGKMVDQKVNYLLGKPFTIETESDEYGKLLQKMFNNKFIRILKNLGEDSLNNGIAWMHPYYNELGEFCFKKFQSYEILPLWKDADHTILDMVIRIYEVEAYEGDKLVVIEKVEIYDANGIQRYILQNGSLIADVENPSSDYVIITSEDGSESGMNWSKIPMIPFKYNNKEIPLIKRVKSLQDGINTMLSDFENNMQEDARNTILVLKNYDGTNLGEFRRNLAQYGAVKVKTVDGSAGDLSTLEVTVNADNYKAILEVFKKALIANARGYDAKDDRMSGNPNQMNIQSMYSDIDLDANGMETEFQASFEELLWFVNTHLAAAGEGDFENETVKVIFNRDILINESETITNCKDSVGILSNETIVGQHPWVTDARVELKRLSDEAATAMEEYQNAFPTDPTKVVDSSGGDPNAQKQ